MDSFYLQLPSNGDPVYHSENTLTEYTIHLPKRIELEGKWQVALVELLYPHNFLQLSNSRTASMKIVNNDFTRIYFPKFRIDGENDEWTTTFAAFINNYLLQRFPGDAPVIIRVNEEKLFTIMLKPGVEVIIDDRLSYILGFMGDEATNLTQTTEPPSYPKSRMEEHEEFWFMDIKRNYTSGYIETLTLPEGFYLKPNRVVEELNSIMSTSKAKDDVKFTYNVLSKSIEIEMAKEVSLELNEAMGQLIGFGGKKTISASIQAPYPIDIDIGFYNLFIYTSLIASDEIVGSSLAPLLRCVPVRGQDGETISEIYQFPFYKPLIRNSFHEISISIRDDIGARVAFSPNGRVNVTLHFKRVE